MFEEATENEKKKQEKYNWNNEDLREKCFKAC